jgi:hypothetical protein
MEKNNYQHPAKHKRNLKKFGEGPHRIIRNRPGKLNLEGTNYRASRSTPKCSREQTPQPILNPPQETISRAEVEPGWGSNQPGKQRGRSGRRGRPSSPCPYRPPWPPSPWLSSRHLRRATAEPWTARHWIKAMKSRQWGLDMEGRGSQCAG